MKSASGSTITLLNTSNKFIFADLYTFTLANNTVFRFTSADIDIKFGGFTFLSRSPQVRIVRSKIKTVIGTQVDEMTLSIYADSTATINGQRWPAFVAAGGFDGATVKLERAFANLNIGWGDTSNGAIVGFSGRVSEADGSRTEILMRVKSDLVLLNINLPRNLWQPACMHTLYDAGCTLLKATFTTSAQCNGGCTTSVLNTTLSAITGFYDQGVITFTSGQNNGLSRSVKSYLNSGQTTLVNPLPFAPAATDAFNIYPGCDHQQSTCSGKFSNLAHFKGAPYIPVPETML